MGKIKLLIQFIIIVPAFVISSQQTDYKSINGHIIAIDFETVSFATIISVKTKLGTISSENGGFFIRVSQTDTLKISSIGFKTKHIAVAELNKEKNYIILTREVYQLSDINIMGFTKWEEFKQEIIHKKLKPLEQKVLVIKGLPDPFTILTPNTQLPSNPISLIYELFKKEAVIKRKQKRWNRIYVKSWQEYHK